MGIKLLPQVWINLLRRKTACAIGIAEHGNRSAVVNRDKLGPHLDVMNLADLRLVERVISRAFGKLSAGIEVGWFRRRATDSGSIKNALDPMLWVRTQPAELHGGKQAASDDSERSKKPEEFFHETRAKPNEDSSATAEAARDTAAAGLWEAACVTSGAFRCRRLG